MNIIKIKKDLIIILIIVVSPFAFYLHTLAPSNEQIWKTNYFTIDAGYFEYVRNYLWIYSYKILTILLLSVWLVTCKNWWRLFLFFPLSLEIYKFLGFIEERFNLFGNINYIESLPIFIIYAIILLLLSKKLNYYSSNKNFKSDLNLEIYNLMKDLSVFKSKDFKRVKSELNSLKKRKNFSNKKELLIELIALRDSVNRN